MIPFVPFVCRVTTLLICFRQWWPVMIPGLLEIILVSRSLTASLILRWLKLVIRCGWNHSRVRVSPAAAARFCDIGRYRPIRAEYWRRPGAAQAWQLEQGAGLCLHLIQSSTLHTRPVSTLGLVQGPETVNKATDHWLWLPDMRHNATAGPQLLPPQPLEASALVMENTNISSLRSYLHFAELLRYFKVQTSVVAS